MQSEITSQSTAWLDRVAWSEDGLAPVVTQESGSGKVLMLAWTNREALRLTAETKQAFYWSRSRQALWRKGEQSGHTQHVVEIRLDCDRDAVLLIVEQAGGVACHTGRHSCFFERLERDHWIADGAILKDPARIYGSG